MEWTQAAFPEAGPRSQLAGTLERCTRELSLERYKDDVRYLRLWLQHVRPVPYVSSWYRYARAGSCF